MRKLVLAIHVSSSVGWLGGIACFLAIAIAGIGHQDAAIVRAAYFGMDWIGWSVLIPLSFASLLTGLIQAFGTQWGLFRHYWVIFKLVINIVANAILLMFMIDLSRTVARLFASPENDLGTLSSPHNLIHPIGGFVLVLTATILSIYKPRGITPYGWRKLQERRYAAR